MQRAPGDARHMSTCGADKAPPMRRVCALNEPTERVPGALGSRVTFRRVVVSLRGPGRGHPFFPSHVASGCCVLSAAAAGVPAGVGSAFAEPGRWCAGAVLDVARCGVGVSAAPNNWRIEDVLVVGGVVLFSSNASLLMNSGVDCLGPVCSPQCTFLVAARVLCSGCCAVPLLASLRTCPPLHLALCLFI